MTMLLRTLALAALAALITAAAATAATPAEQLYPLNLRVSGGEANWHAGNDFRLDWDQPPIASQGFPVSAVNYRARDASGAVVIPTTRLPWGKPEIDHIHVPPVPGVYTAEVWLEGPDGEPGPTRSATLRFDNFIPGPVRPLVPPGWVAGDARAVVRIKRSDGPLPISGIRGYALAVDRGDGGSPCAVPGRCSPGETDLDGGIGDDTASLGGLAEGVHVVRALAVSGAGVSSATVGTAVIRVDAGRPRVELSGATNDWADGPVRLAARATDPLSGMRTSGAGGPYTAIAVDGAVPKAEPGDTAATTVSGEGAHTVAAFARDAAGNSSEAAPAVATIAIDESPPAVAFARAQDPAEPERIEATVDDALSGPNSVRGSIAVRPAGTRRRWQPLPTTVLSGRLVARWDSDSFAPGGYEFRATGYDAAANAANSERRRNGARMILRSPLKAPTRIEAGLGAKRLPERVSRYAHGAPYRGRLSLASGEPLAGMPVRLIEAFDPGSELAQRVTVVETGPDGSFRSQLAPGPSRRVEAAFVGSRVLARSSGGHARLEVGAGIRLRASVATARVGGAPVVFSGRVGSLEAALPAEGMPVELQFRLGRGRWREFRTVQTGADGRFRYAYAFSDDDSRGVRFQFRAYVTGGDWPYEPAASKPVIVSGR
jgi:hypothetical protein